MTDVVKIYCLYYVKIAFILAALLISNNAFVKEKPTFIYKHIMLHNNKRHVDLCEKLTFNNIFVQNDNSTNPRLTVTIPQNADIKNIQGCFAKYKNGAQRQSMKTQRNVG